MRVRFGPFEFDAATRELLRGGQRVHLSPKSFDLLQILVEERPALVTKAELQDRLWPDAVVLEANLGNAVAEIRKALGDDPRSPKYIATVSRRGYRFSASVETSGPAEAARPHAALRWWLVWRDAILPLSDGTNVVGRHPECDVWIDAGSVSRAHADIVIADGRAAVEDRGSTNGTFVNGARTGSRHALVDGDAVAFGSERTVFRAWSDATAPATEPVRATRPAAPERGVRES
jgi:DNA-binding winged helix-turn-helix (wHTH) protein